jgi:hypothetical protein
VALRVTIIAADGSEVQDAATEPIIVTVNDRTPVSQSRMPATNRQAATSRGY